MSFYTGKYNGSFKCHITKGQHDIVTMRGAPSTPTVFHTDIRYVDYVIEPLGASDGSISYYTRTGYYYNMSANIKNYIAAGYSFFVYDLSIQRYAYEGILIESQWYRSVNDMVQLLDYYTDTTTRMNEDINAQRVYCKKNTSNLIFVFYGIKYDGTKKNLLSQNRNGEIKINNTMFNVGGYDVLNFPYMNPNVLNAVDKKIYSSDGTFVVQLINSEPKGPGLNLISNKTETTIKAGGQTVITTAVGSSLIEFGESYNTYNTPRYTVTVGPGQYKEVFHKCSDAILSPGQVFSMGIYSSGFPSMRMLKYKEGDIQSLERYTIGEESSPWYQHGIVIFGQWGKIYAKLYARFTGSSGTFTYVVEPRNISLNILK